jgi:hypothetical protein
VPGFLYQPRAVEVNGLRVLDREQGLGERMVRL